MGGSGRDALYSDLHEDKTNKKVDKLQYLINIMNLKQSKKWKGCGQYWSSWSYNIRESGKVAVCNDHHDVTT